MNVTIGRYKQSAWTFFPGSRLITLFNILDPTDISAVNVMAVQRTAIPAPTVGAATSGGSVNVGTHNYLVTFVTALGESLAGAISAPITIVSGSQTVPLTNIPTGAGNSIYPVTARNIYRTNAGGSTYYLVGTLSDNVTTIFTDTTADNTTTAAPAAPASTGAFGVAAPSLVNLLALGYSHPWSAPVAGTPTSGGSLGVGNYYYAVTNVIGGSETVPSPVSNTVTTTSSNKTVALSSIPLGPYGTTARNIYRTTVGGSALYLVGTISDNSTTTYSDTLADTTATAAPTTSTAYDLIMSSTEPVLESTDVIYLKLDVTDNLRDEYLNVLKVADQVKSELPPTDPQVAAYTDTNLSAATYYEVPASGWRNYMAQLIVTATTNPTVIQIFATLDNTIAASATPVTGWVNVTNSLYPGLASGGSLSVPAGTTFSDIRNWGVDVSGKPAMYNRFCIVYTPGNLTTNFWQMNVLQF